MTQQDSNALGKAEALRVFANDVENFGLDVVAETPDSIRDRAGRLGPAWGKGRGLKASSVAVGAFIHAYRMHAMNAREKAIFLAKPLYDGTEGSCRNLREFEALDDARHEVEAAMAEVDTMADWLVRKMDGIKNSLKRLSTETERRKFNVTPVQAMGYSGMNSLGEIQGNGNIDALILKLHAKREAFERLVNALGYRVSNGMYDGRF